MKQNIYVFSPQLPGLLLLSFVYLMKHNMSSLHNSRAFVLPSFVAFVLTSSSNSQLPTNKTGTCDVDPRSNETFNENYRTNLTFLFDYSSKALQSYSFYNDTYVGIYGLFLCRGDVSNITCQTCVKVSGHQITSECPQSRSAILWNADCTIRYSDFDVAKNRRYSR